MRVRVDGGRPVPTIWRPVCRADRPSAGGLTRPVRSGATGDDRAGHRRRARRLPVKARNAARTGSHCRFATATPAIVTQNLDTDVILVSRVEVTRLLSISVAEIDRLLRNGELVAWRKGRHVP